MKVTTGQAELLTMMLRAASLRQRVLAHNIANVNTPEYKRLDVAFEHDLARALKAGRPGRAGPVVVEGEPTAFRVDGNTVGIEQEVGRLNDNELAYAAAAQLLATRLAALRSAITGR